VPEVVHAVVAGQAILWVRTSDEFREAILDALDRQDILVRGDPGDGVRISLADAATNDRVIAALGDRHSFKAIR
jgi:histidinol-phosphate aminotransferase